MRTIESHTHTLRLFHTQPGQLDSTDPLEYTEGEAAGVSEEEDDVIRRDVMLTAAAGAGEQGGAGGSPCTCSPDSDKENRGLPRLPSQGVEQLPFSVVVSAMGMLLAKTIPKKGVYVCVCLRVYVRACVRACVCVSQSVCVKP